MNAHLKNFEREFDRVSSRLAKTLVIGLAKSGVTGAEITGARRWGWTKTAILIRADVTSATAVSTRQLLGIMARASCGRPVSVKGTNDRHSWAMTQLMLDDYPRLQTALALDALSGATSVDIHGDLALWRQFRVNAAQTHMTMVGGDRVATFVINMPTLI